MRVSLNWLKEYTDIKGVAEEIAAQMTMLGLEIEAIDRPGAEIRNVLIGKILSIERHPDADKIVVCKTDVGGPEPLQICCGATNMKVGDKVPTAVDGATLPGGFKIGRRKMRGVESCGMMCSSKELGLGADHEGLLILDPALPVGADAVSALGLDDVIFEIEVTPNRGDWASMIGVARELAAANGTSLRIPAIVLRESGAPAADLSSVTVENSEWCPRYLGRVLTEVKVGESPEWLKKRLLAAGQRPINNVVDVTNYVLMETGQPLHAFDLDRLAENRVVVRAAYAGEEIRTLDGATRLLTEDMLVIADAEKAQCIAGVMGGADSEVGERTTRVFLECAYFDPVSVRRTSRALGLISESSQRFQRGADRDMLEYAINRAAALIAEVSGARVAPGILDSCPQTSFRREVTLRYQRTAAVLGAHIAPEEQRAILTALGFELLREDEVSVTVAVPHRRHDVTREADLIEEIARLHGFEKIPATLPRVRPMTQRLGTGEKTLRALRQFLADQGLTEFYSWSFSSPEDVLKAGLAESHADMVMLENPLSERHAGMRTTLLTGLLHATAYNLNRGAESIAAFEIGPVYRVAENATGSTQEMRLGIVLCGARGPLDWSTRAVETDFYDMKGRAEAVCAFYGQSVEATACAMPLYQVGQAAEFRVNGTTVGHFGKVSHAAAKNFDLDRDVFVLEMNLELLGTLPRQHAQFVPIPEFPPAPRDLAIMVDAHVPAGSLVETARRAGGKLLRKVEIFDVFTGGAVPAGKKSIAMRLIFQSPERTLTDADTEKALAKALKLLEQEHGAQLR